MEKEHGSTDGIIDRNIVKFGFYGFFKNLKFFEPFFYLYLLSIGLNYFQIGIILAVRELSTYVFEIPTGVIADIWGRKRSILLCFILYSLSFLVYYIAGTFWILIPASVVFGLGEAFRLGTHKAIIFDYLDDRGIGGQKARVYGFTRSVSLVGSALSAIGAGTLVLWTENYRAGFLFSIIPYLTAFGLVLTYPSSRHDRSLGGKGIWKRLKAHAMESMASLKNVRDLRLSLVNSAIYDSAFRAGKDYIQPMIQTMVLAGAAAGARGMEVDTEQGAYTLLISGFYLVIYLISAVCSKKAHLFEKLCKSSECSLNLLFILNAAAFLAVGIFAGVNLPLLILFFIMLFVFFNLRRPILLDYMTEHIEPQQRATMLSIDSQLRSLGVIVLAPAMGLLADHFSFSVMFTALAAVLGLLYVLFLRFEKN